MNLRPNLQHVAFDEQNPWISRRVTCRQIRAIPDEPDERTPQVGAILITLEMEMVLALHRDLVGELRTATVIGLRSE